MVGIRETRIPRKLHKKIMWCGMTQMCSRSTLTDVGRINSRAERLQFDAVNWPSRCCVVLQKSIERSKEPKLPFVDCFILLVPGP